MKKIILLITTGLLLIGCGSQPKKGTEGNWDASKDITPTQNGKKHGLVKNYNYKGELMRTSTYVNGLKNGPDTIYNRRNHKVSSVTQYVNGKKNGLSILYQYNKNDISSYRKTNYKNGLIDGFDNDYNANGTPTAINPYKNGKRHGTRSQWFGKILLNSVKFKNNKKVGAEKRYDINTGKLVETIIWSNGVEKKRYYSTSTKQQIAANERDYKEFNKEYEKERKAGKYAMPNSSKSYSSTSSKGRTQITNNDGRFIGGVCSNGNSFFIEKKSLLYEGSGSAVCTKADLQQTISCVCAGV